ncbi:hypothetical protein LTR84_005843 [Exophiala bonariae]|uniref:Uncharacterized protein n=1 Tax=Exophiala bonariae TaxID=1690606 RepID=A0AAV9N253_9EURO|nr:hypothetical protein LTR84_005843 [Exophiala bonariae]
MANTAEEISYVITFGPWVARWLNLDFSTAVDIDHENDRYTAFTILVLGEFTYAILVGSPAKGGLNLNVMRAVWTLVIAFCFNSMYVYTDGSVQHKHPIRRAVWSSFAWLLIHLPLSAGLLVGGHVSAATVKDEYLSTGQRWLWGGGLGTGTFCLFLIALLYEDDDPHKFLRFNKIDSTQLVSIGAVLMLLVVAWEIFGSLERDAPLFESWNTPELDDDQDEDAPIFQSDDHRNYETFRENS